jgi:peptide-methionine (S)-S-oxide reductase
MFPEYPMTTLPRQPFTALLSLLFVAASGCSPTNAAPVAAPRPAVDMPSAPGGATETAVFAGGCFWGIEAVFEHVKGVQQATSGYAGGTKATADYEMVSAGSSGHAESVQVVYDPAQVSYGQLLRVFFSVAHDPTQLNRQGPDSGTQYRSAIFFANADQQRVAQAYIEQLTAARLFSKPIVTQLAPLAAFFPAEAYHQDYAAHHPNAAYIVFNDAPKVARLKKQLPELYAER